MVMTQSLFVFADTDPAASAQEDNTQVTEPVVEETVAEEEPVVPETVPEETETPAEESAEPAAEEETSATEVAEEAAPAAAEGTVAAEENTESGKAAEEADQPAAKKADDTNKTDLEITNKTGMFKAVSAYLITENGQEYLVMALSSTGYHELCKGTYEQAVAGGDGSKDKGNTWVHGETNKDGKLEFKIPLSAGESYVPCVAVSATYYTNYLNGWNSLERAFYPRQFTIDRAAKTLVTGDYDETAAFAVTSNVADFKAEAAASTHIVGGPNSNNYNVAPVLTMQDNTYDYVFYPALVGGEIDELGGEAGLENGQFEISLLNAPTLEVFKDKTPIEMMFHVAANAPYEEAGDSVLRYVTIDKMAKTITITGDPLTPKKEQTDPADPSKPDTPSKPGTPSKPDKPAKPDKPSGGDSSQTDKKEYADKTDGQTSAVNASTTLKDGEYTPDSFSWSGGTNRVSISCPKITVRNGQAYATIVFTSSSFDQLRANGSTYYKQGGGNSTFVIPVNLNANNTIIGRTTAMSQPHWIEYTIYVGKAESAEDAAKVQAAKKEAAEAKLKMSDTAPTIIGLKTKDGKEAKSDTSYAKYFKIFEYEQGVKLISIDISQDTELHKEYTENAEKAVADSEKEETVEYDDDGNVITKSPNEYTEALYKNNIVNYLLVPEDFEVPAGLDKEYIIVTVPAEKTFMASPEAIKMMEDLKCLDAVSLLGMDEKDVKSETLEKALKDDTVKLAGDLEKPDYQKVVKDKTDLVILPGDVLPEEIKKDAKDKDKLTEEAKEMQKNLEKLESRFTTLDAPVIIDRSAQEKDELAQAEWIKVYGALYGCEEQADKIFDELVKKADKE